MVLSLVNIRREFALSENLQKPEGSIGVGFGTVLRIQAMDNDENSIENKRPWF